MAIDLGLLILRLVVGLLLVTHGVQKLFGWFGGPGFKPFTLMLGGHMRMRPALLWALLAGLSEAGGGLLLALGLFNPLGSLGLIAAMLVAVNVHWPKFWVTEGGLEYALVILTGALVVALTGPGSYSLDNALGLQLPEPLSLLVGLALVVIGVAVALLTRRPIPVETPEAAPVAAQPTH